MKKTLLITGGLIGTVLLLQAIKYNICKSNVKKALLDPTLQGKYMDCTENGFRKEELGDANHYTVSATVSKFPFKIKLTKWNTSDEIYWNDVK